MYGCCIGAAGMMRCCTVILTQNAAAILLAKDNALLMLVTKAHTEKGTRVMILPHGNAWHADLDSWQGAMHGSMPPTKCCHCELV